MKIMKPIASNQFPQQSDFIYEVKYDGFRARLIWQKDNFQLLSKNNVDLTEKFPEIMEFCKKIKSRLAYVLPLIFDGELVILNHSFQANFSAIQERGRLKSSEKIQKLATERPATLMVFDILQYQGMSVQDTSLKRRKTTLKELFHQLKLSSIDNVQLIQTYEDITDISQVIFVNKGEGMIAKRKTSTYHAGKQHQDWFKVKNWRRIHAFLISYNPNNDYYKVGVFNHGNILRIGNCKHGLDDHEAAILKEMFMQNGEKTGGMYHLPPAICAAIHTLDLHGGELREPQFVEILPNERPVNCTRKRLEEDLAMFPDVGLSNLDKLFWSQKSLTKGKLVTYVREIFPWMIPYVKNRALTIVRCPDGVEEASFYQKNLPSYAPDYVEHTEDTKSKMIVCNKLESLIWLANHGTIEYHIPFQLISSPYPVEIVFDLDPPSRDYFSLAVRAARLIKKLLDELEVISFVKTSGNKGLQIHVPIPLNLFSYEETRVITQAIANTLETIEPNLFTTERMKKQRKGKLYIDYIQHGENKTIITPYSPRKTDEATVATPLYWDEVNESLDPVQFTIENVVERIQTHGCPWFFRYEEAREKNVKPLRAVIES